MQTIDAGRSGASNGAPAGSDGLSGARVSARSRTSGASAKRSDSVAPRPWVTGRSVPSASTATTVGTPSNSAVAYRISLQLVRQLQSGQYTCGMAEASRSVAEHLASYIADHRLTAGARLPPERE